MREAVAAVNQFFDCDSIVGIAMQRRDGTVCAVFS